MSQDHHVMLLLEALQCLPDAFRLQSKFPPVTYHGLNAQTSAAICLWVPMLYLLSLPLCSENRLSSLLPLALVSMSVSPPSSEVILWPPQSQVSPCWLLSHGALMINFIALGLLLLSACFLVPYLSTPLLKLRLPCSCSLPCPGSWARGVSWAGWAVLSANVLGSQKANATALAVKLGRPPRGLEVSTDL